MFAATYTVLPAITASEYEASFGNCFGIYLLITVPGAKVNPLSELKNRSGSTKVIIKVSGSFPIETLRGKSNSNLSSKSFSVKLVNSTLNPSMLIGAEVSSDPLIISALIRLYKLRSLS